PVTMADDLGPFARELESLPASEDTPRFLYEGRDYTLATADGRLFVAVPDDGPLGSVQVDVPVAAGGLAACAAAEILSARAQRDEHLRRARVDVRCDVRGIRLRVLFRREDMPHLTDALERILLRPPTPDEIADARARLERDLTRNRRDPRRLGAAARDLALFGDSAMVRLEPSDLVAERLTQRTRALFDTHLSTRPDVAVTGHDITSWQGWFAGLPAPREADRARRRLQRTPRRIVVPAPEAGVAYVAWSAAYGRIGSDDVATAEILRATLADRWVGLERKIGAQGPLQVRWRRDGPDPAPGAALVAEILVPPGRALDTLAAIEAALAEPPDATEVAAVRAQVERTYRTLGTPRHRIASFVREFVLAAERSDPRARIWARLAQVDAAAVDAAWRRLAEAPRIETIVTPRPSPAFEASGTAPVVVVPAEALLPR
ncbi:MAG: hypothetical protein D6705_15045, partial [Deltaproteobacteria bacterium]